jgi:hypothetical protein
MAFGQDPTFTPASTFSGVLPSTLDWNGGAMNAQYFNQIADFVAKYPGASLKSFYWVRWFDTLRIDAGTMPQKNFSFFSQPKGAQGALFIAGTNYTKNSIDTNMRDTGRLLLGYESLIWSMQLMPRLTGTLDSTVETSGDFINLPLITGTGTTAAAAGSGGIILQNNLLRALQSSCAFTFKLNQSPFESGTLDLFPTSYGATWGVAVDGNNFINDGRINNSLVGAIQLPIMRQLPALTNFEMLMEVQNPFVNPEPLTLVCLLEGIGIQPLNG